MPVDFEGGERIGLAQAAPGVLPVSKSHFPLESFPGPAAVIAAGTLHSVNRAFSALLGRSPEHLRGLNATRLWSDREEGEAFRRLCHGHAERTPDFSLEARWARLDRPDLWVELKGRRMGGADGQSGAWMVVATDISRHRRTQEFLQIQRSLVDSSQDGIAIVNRSSSGEEAIAFVNAAWEKMTGYAAEEALGRPPSILLGADREQVGAAILGHAVEQNRAANESLRHYRKDGVLIYVDISVFPLPVEQGRPRQFVMLSRDITKRRETELLLIASERRFRHFFSDNRLPMLLVERGRGRIIEANAAATAFYGYTPLEWSKHRLDDLLANAPEKASTARPNPTEERVQHRMADGSVRDVVSYDGELQVADGPVRYVIVVDVTAQREAEEKLRQAMEAAKTANAAKSEFLQVVGHEIRTPMNAIQGFANLLSTSETQADLEESAEMILQGARDLTAVLDGVLDYIDWSSGSVRGADVETDLLELAMEGAGDYRLRAEAKGLTFRAQWPEDLGPLCFPTTDYARMVLILLDNAVKFTDHGSVSLDLSVPVKSNRLVIRVSDTGIGIDPALGDRLFTPFCSGDEGTRRAYGGIGLGLARCARMAKAHGGRLHYQSLLGEGSTFVLELPVRHVPAPEGAKEGPKNQR